MRILITAAFLLGLGCVNQMPKTPQNTHPHESPCEIVMSVYCEKGQVCGFWDEGLCRQVSIPQCTSIEGITGEEASVCAAALGSVPCDGNVPTVCVGIGQVRATPGIAL